MRHIAMLALVVLGDAGCGRFAGLASHTDHASRGLEGAHCVVTATIASCEPRVVRYEAGWLRSRSVYWQRPDTPPGPAGYPVAFVFQGSWLGPQLTWKVTGDGRFGARNQARLQAELLRRGFVVIAPEALGGIAWQTNTGLDFAGSSDDRFMQSLLSDLDRGRFAPIDRTRLYATGISSGGYMTSRMAVSFPGRFRALGIHSASYASCMGALCEVPARVAADHPPTLFLHGARDRIVPQGTAERYAMALRVSGVTAELIVDERAGHEWLDEAPEAIASWFERH